MAAQAPDPQPPIQQLDNQRPWGDTKVINGQKCRQCRRCGNWFNIGWLAYHGCPVNPQLRLFDPPRLKLSTVVLTTARLIQFEIANTLVCRNANSFKTQLQP